MKRLSLVLCLLAACACKSRSETGPGKGTGTGTGTDVGTGGDPAKCDGLRAHLEELYQADADATVGSGSGTGTGTGTSPEDLKKEMVADNVTMAMSDCKAAPDRVVACAEKANTAAELEELCLIPLDEEGTEGDRFKVEKE